MRIATTLWLVATPPRNGGVISSRKLKRRRVVGYAPGRRRRCLRAQSEGRHVLPPPPESHPPKQSPAVDVGPDDPGDGKEDEPSRRPNFFARVAAAALQILGSFSKRFLHFTTKPLFRIVFFTLCLFGGQALFSVRNVYSINVMFSEFVKQVEAGRVQAVYFESKSNRIRLVYDSGMWEGLRSKIRERHPRLTPSEVEKVVRRIRVFSEIVPGQTESLTHLLKKKRVKYGVAETSARAVIKTFLVTMFMLWVPLLPLIYLLSRTLNQRLGGKNRKVQRYSMPKVRFTDVAGMEAAKVELLEVVELLKNPNKYAKLNAKGPSGVLLYGPTGTGKTLLARAVAGEAGVPFFAVSGSEFVEMFVGRGAARIRDLFREARKSKPCVVFIDEIDAVGGLRGTSFNDERDQTLNQLLVELDGFDENMSIVLLAATNRFGSLDPALLRPGRLTRKIRVALPDFQSRAAILAVHLRDVPMESSPIKYEACAFVAKFAVGFSGAELANTVNEAALMAARENRDYVEVGDLIRGLQRTKEPVNRTTNPPWLSSFQQKLLDKIWKDAKS